MISYLFAEKSEPEAKSLAIKLELFTNGSLNIFVHQTNVDIQSRILSFNIFNLGKQLKTMGLLVIPMQLLIVLMKTGEKEKEHMSLLMKSMPFLKMKKVQHSSSQHGNNLEK